MLRHTGFVATALGLAIVGPSASSELLGQSQEAHDPLTQAWFDTVQSIGTLEGLNSQLAGGHPGAVQNLLRNTEDPLGDGASRQHRIDQLQLEIDRMRSELELLRLNIRPRTSAPESTPAEAEPIQPRIRAHTVGMTSDERRALIMGGQPEPDDDVAAQLAAARARYSSSGDAAPAAPTEPAPWTPPTTTQPSARAENTPAASIDAIGGSAPLSEQPPGSQPRMPRDPNVVDSLPTTLVMDPGEPARSAALAGVGAAATPEPIGAGTASIADRVAAAEEQVKAAEAADLRASLAGAYSADVARQGRAAYFAGEYARALQILAPLTDDPFAVYWTGRCYEKLERVEDAMRSYEAVIAMPEPGEWDERAQRDLDFLLWKWEQFDGFEAIRQTASASGGTGQ